MEITIYETLSLGLPDVCRARSQCSLQPSAPRAAAIDWSGERTTESRQHADLPLDQLPVSPVYPAQPTGDHRHLCGQTNIHIQIRFICYIEIIQDFNSFQNDALATHGPGTDNLRTWPENSETFGPLGDSVIGMLRITGHCELVVPPPGRGHACEP